MGKGIEAAALAGGAIVGAVATKEVLEGIQSRTEQNRPYLEELTYYANLIHHVEKLPFASPDYRIVVNERRLEEIGLEDDTFGDSRMMRNHSPGIWTPDRWRHSGGFPLIIRDDYRRVGFPKVQVFPYAKQGNPSWETVAAMHRAKEQMIASDKDQRISVHDTGNSFLKKGEKLRDLFLTAYFPEIADLETFCGRFEEKRRAMSDDVVAELEIGREVHNARRKKKKRGLETFTFYSPPPFIYTDKIMTWHDEDSERVLFALPVTERFIFAGQVITGGAIWALNDGLQRFQAAHQDEDIGFPIVVIPCNSIDQSEAFDGTFHYRNGRNVADRFHERTDIELTNGNIMPFSEYLAAA